MTSEDTTDTSAEASAAPLEWPVLLGLAIGAQTDIEAGDPEGLLQGTVPRPPATEDRIAAAETTLGRPLPEAYRDFLGFADGWPGMYFTLDLFGTPELSGEGLADRARSLMETYEAEGDLADSGLDPADLIPIAASQGIDLAVIVPSTGSVVWFDGGEYGRYEDFTEFVTELVALLQSYATGPEVCPGS